MEHFSDETASFLNLSLTEGQISAFKLYEEELTKWNKIHNLTAIRDIEGIRKKHFLDSLTCLLAFKKEPPKNAIDIGTGAGFPGIPLKILFPNLKLTLLDSVKKKVDFCKHLVELLELQDVEVIQSRAEDLGQDSKHREQYDLALARAVANLSTLAEYLLPFVRIGGLVISQKGENGPAEAHSAEKAVKVLGGHTRQLMPIEIPGVAETRYLILIDKIAATPKKYPRRVSIPTKNPLI